MKKMRSSDDRVYYKLMSPEQETSGEEKDRTKRLIDTEAAEQRKPTTTTVCNTDDYERIMATELRAYRSEQVSLNEQKNRERKERRFRNCDGLTVNESTCDESQ